jgi:gamma-glutamyl hercynylcysteine S-oxide synthase
MAKPSEEIEDVSQIEVKLKPFLGIEPGVYLTILYSIAALFILFMLLLFPGIKKNGTEYKVESLPAGAAIHVDGFYAGSTPAKVFVTKGTHTLTINRPHFSGKELEIAAGGRVFGSLFVPKKDEIHAVLSLGSEESFLASRLVEISEWALVSQFGPSYQPPRLISETVSSYYLSGGEDTVLLDRFLIAALSSLSGEVFIADYMRGLLLHQANGLVPTAATLAKVIDTIVSLMKDKPGLSLLAATALSEDTLQKYRESDWFKNVITGYREKIDKYNSFTSSQAKDERIIGGLPFVFVPDGKFVMGMPVGSGPDGELPHPEIVPGFYMLKGEVTRDWYSAFLEASPSWHPENLNTLAADGLIDEWYLHDWAGETASDVPVAYVSYYAAKAFAAWFDDSLPEAWSGFSARLPEEVEWEWAALLNATGEEVAGKIFADGPSPLSGLAGVEHLVGSLWEWCDTWFHQADYYVKPWNPEDDATAETHDPLFALGAEAVVRGGSWANTEEDQVSRISRGSQRPEWCTPFTGFRIVLVRK